MRLGLLVRADKTGLGYQTLNYYKHLKPHKTIIIDISSLNGNEQHYGWYEDAHVIKGIPKDEQLTGILSDIDVLMTAETPYNVKLYQRARELGVKTVAVENPEFFDQFRYPDFPLPDLIILPSTWLENDIRKIVEPRGVKVIVLHNPVDRDVYKYTNRTVGRHFHINGKPAAHDRNGMHTYFEAFYDGTLLTQDKTISRDMRRRHRHSKVYDDIADNTQLYSYGDILVLPRKYGGNCLPMQEALSSGCPVIMPDVSPNRDLLPMEWLVPARYVDYFEPRGRVNIYEAEIDALRERAAWVRENISSQSERANQIADTISWNTMRDKYLNAIQELL